jgi:hypothetical protein
MSMQRCFSFNVGTFSMLFFRLVWLGPTLFWFPPGVYVEKFGRRFDTAIVIFGGLAAIMFVFWNFVEFFWIQVNSLSHRRHFSSAEISNGSGRFNS